MKLITVGKMVYQLRLDDGHFAGSLIYTDSHFSAAGIYTGSSFTLEKSGAGCWITRQSGEEEVLATCKVELDGRISLQTGNTIYSFVKPVSWKPRFCLHNQQQEEIAALLPVINWVLDSFDFSLQLNDEFSDETGAFLILHALHCAVCGMAMLNGIMTPAIGTLNG